MITCVFLSYWCVVPLNDGIWKLLVGYMLSYLTSFLVNSPTLSSCSSSGILSSIRCWTISAILSTQSLQAQVRLLFLWYYRYRCQVRVDVNHATVRSGAEILLHTCVEVVMRSLFRFRLRKLPSGNTHQSVWRQSEFKQVHAVIYWFNVRISCWRADTSTSLLFNGMK